MAGESAGSVPGPENCAANSSYDVSKSFASPPRWELQNSPPPGAARAVQEEGSSAPLFSDADLQRMVAMEQRAPLLFGSPPQQPGPHTESSSIPHDAIQPEVARQLAGMRQELDNQMRRASQAEAELSLPDFSLVSLKEQSLLRHRRLEGRGC